jgi:TonB family protein
MKLTIAISTVAHLVLIGLLNAHLPVTTGSIVTMSIFDHAAPPSVRPAPATDRPIAEHAAREHAPRPRMRRVARALPPTAPPPPMPIAPEPEPAAAPAPEISGDTDGAATEDEAADLAPASPAHASLRRDPDLEPGSCVRGLSHPDPGKARSEIVVHLRLALDDKGQVSDVAVTRPVGDGFDEIAVRAVREKCRFTPALDDRGRPVSFVIDEFRFRFPPAGMAVFIIP